MDRAAALAGAAMAPGGTHLTRQAASALCHVTSAAAMAWEAAQLDDPARLAMAGMGPAPPRAAARPAGGGRVAPDE